VSGVGTFIAESGVSDMRAARHWQHIHAVPDIKARAHFWGRSTSARGIARQVVLASFAVLGPLESKLLPLWKDRLWTRS